MWRSLKLYSTILVLILVISLSTLAKSSDFTSISVAGNWTEGFGVNDRGQVVGSYYDSAQGWLNRGYLFDDGSITLIDFPNAQMTRLYDINDRGQIIGSCSFQGSGHSFLLDRPSRTDIH